QQVDVAAAAVPEVEVLADDDDPGVEAVDQHLADEVLGRLAAAGLVEGDDQAVVDPRLGQQLELLVEVGEQPGRRLGSHDRGRVAVEGDDGGGQAPRPGLAAHLVDHRAVADVDAVVGTDRHHRATGGSGAGGQVADDVHRAGSVPGAGPGPRTRPAGPSGDGVEGGAQVGHEVVGGLDPDRQPDQAGV